MKAYYHDHFVLPLPPGHRFPMAKYQRLRERILAESLLHPEDVLVSPPASDEDLLRVHSRDYLSRVVEGSLSAREIRRIGFPWSPEMVERSRRSVGGTLAAAAAARQEGLGINLAGGTHHARADRGSGFCVFNDVAVAARVAQFEGFAERILLLDCDVHQGDGSAAIFAGDPTVFTFSIHGEKNFPFTKIPGDLDLSLPDGTGDQEYLEILRGGVARAFALFEPNLVFYLAGADPYHGDSFGRLALTKEGLRRRDEWVLNRCRSADLPTVIVMGGGYARSVEDIVDIHLSTVTVATRTFAPHGRSEQEAL